MSKKSTRDNTKGTSFKSFIGVLKPIRDWLKNTPPVVVTNGRSSVPANCSNGNNHLGSLSTINGSSPKSSTPSQIVHTNHLLGKGPVEQASNFRPAPLNTNLVRQQQNRMSLPLMQQHKMRRQVQSQLTMRRLLNQMPPCSMGNIYLQYKGETKQASLPNEITAIDTIWALFVCAFPNLLTMEFMSQPHVKIYIYNPNCNLFYELRDIDDIKHDSVLRIHQSDPLLALPQQYQTMRLAPPQIPPPKPRRMIPVVNPYQQQQQQQQMAHHASSNSLIYGVPINHDNPSPVTPMQFQPQHYNSPQPQQPNQYQQAYIQQLQQQQQQQLQQMQQQQKQQQYLQQHSQLSLQWPQPPQEVPLSPQQHQQQQQQHPQPTQHLNWPSLQEVQPSCLQLSHGI